MLTPGKIKP